MISSHISSLPCKLHGVPSLDSNASTASLSTCKGCLPWAENLESIEALLTEASHQFFEPTINKESTVQLPATFSELLNSKEQNLKALIESIEIEKKSSQAQFDTIENDFKKYLQLSRDRYFQYLDKQISAYKALYALFEKHISKVASTTRKSTHFESKDDLIRKIKQTKDTSELAIILNQLRNELKASPPKMNLLNGLAQKIKNQKKFRPEGELEGYTQSLKKFMSELDHELKEKPIVIPHPTSSILTSEDFDLLSSWLNPIYPFEEMSLIYQGKKDGLNAASFHDCCDHEGPTLTVIKSKNYENVFGGFIDQSWGSTGKYLTSSNAFLFSITHKEKYELVDNETQSGYAAYDHKDFGPTFGRGYDLLLVDEFGNAIDNCCERSSYDVDDGKKLAGGYHFEVDDIEVFQLLRTKGEGHSFDE